LYIFYTDFGTVYKEFNTGYKIANITYPLLLKVVDDCIYFDCIIRRSIELPLSVLMLKKFIETNKCCKTIVISESENFLSNLWNITIELSKN